MRQWLKQAVSLCEIAKNGSYEAKKQALLEINGLNLFLKTKKAQPTAAQTLSPPKNIWSALRAAKEKAALSGDNFPFSSVLVPRAGVEPATLSLGRICSIQLSYRGMMIENVRYSFSATRQSSIYAFVIAEGSPVELPRRHLIL